MHVYANAGTTRRHSCRYVSAACFICRPILLCNHQGHVTRFPVPGCSRGSFSHAHRRGRAYGGITHRSLFSYSCMLLLLLPMSSRRRIQLLCNTDHLFRRLRGPSSCSPLLPSRIIFVLTMAWAMDSMREVAQVLGSCSVHGGDADAQAAEMQEVRRSQPEGVSGSVRIREEVDSRMGS